MSLPLPPDPAHWPKDPCELLGVGQDADLREIRRAYARLTKLYRPDHSPQEFQLIRAAYDRLSAWQEFRSQFHSNEVEVPQESPQSDSHAPSTEVDVRFTSDSGLVPATPNNPIPRDSLVDGLDAVRQLIQDGEFVACHQKLNDLDRDYPDNEDVKLRLCWLRSLFPELSPGHDPLEFLSGFAFQTQSLRTWRVLLQFLEFQPESLLSSRVDEWFPRPIPQYPLTRLLEMRWKLAARTGQYAKILDDLEQLEERLTRIGTGVWLSIVLLAMRVTRWFQHADVELIWDRAHEEFRESSGESLSVPRLYDEQEWLVEVREQIETQHWSTWRSPRSVSLIGQEQADAWLAVLQSASVASESEWRTQLEALLAPWMSSPGVALDSAQELCFRFPAMASVVHRFLQAISTPSKRSPYILTRAEQSLNYVILNSTPASHTRQAKLNVLTFCVDEGVDLRELCQLLTGSQVKCYQVIYDDPALELAILATRRFWELPTAELRHLY